MMGGDVSPGTRGVEGDVPHCEVKFVVIRDGASCDELCSITYSPFQWSVSVVGL
jgi:hypothetical protein